ncbi:Ca-activated chloride channel family protein [Nakamurella panacisegetis]|uniref:Ca-activated chloride channel family protein n=1 Tax=Nakamurella panacisegetis TaxID=1090615 RepID=A0A1H0Q652_9ACTN|nr:extracellular solute-binding protein [Nakamurella panacisegetis]SDP12871.1 Ca-activated chloride channel family protein [Nakamurella panacisegetis]
MAGRSKAPYIAAAVAGVLLIVGIKIFTGTTSSSGTAASTTGAASTTAPVVREGCTTVNVSASSEKAALMATIAKSYAASGRTVAGACYDIVVTSLASGTGEANLAAGWNESVDGPAPDVWTPAASSWVTLLRSDLVAKDKTNILPDQSKSIVSTPLVLAMPQPMAQALGWPKARIGWSDILGLVQAKGGWASKGHKEWGAFTLGKTNPTISTSGLNATVGALVAATGKSSDLTQADLKNPKVRSYVQAVEHSVVHYGDTTLTYLSNLQRADDSGGALNYLSAVAVEEKSVLDYNAGNPSGDPATLGRHAPPKVPLVAVYPKEGTLYSDSPYVVLKASWSTPAKQAGANDFLAYLLAPEQQKVFTDANFRTFDHQAGAPIKASSSVIADGVKVTLNPPGSAVLAGVRSLWSDLRKRARVLLLLDVSGSMGDDAGSSGLSKLDLAKRAAASALGQLSDTDEVGLWTFTTGLSTPSKIYSEDVPIAPLAKDRTQLTTTLSGLIPKNGTPLYAATRQASQYMNSSVDPDLINAVVVLTDGKNEYTDDDLDSLVSDLSSSAAENGVRVFSIAYGADADLDTLQKISGASRAAAYDARKPESITKVFGDVLSNF